ncbi:MAG: hypothetical protein CMK89_02225 [Pseudomonadales bacterium]|nr:hypothetical protein [Pseudomonadales bacterium]|tara:strand:- start:3078 stop:3446 length:369 start_codon:yes stop_codon:yes gene_type:complete
MTHDQALAIVTFIIQVRGDNSGKGYKFENIYMTSTPKVSRFKCPQKCFAHIIFIRHHKNIMPDENVNFITLCETRKPQTQTRTKPASASAVFIRVIVEMGSVQIKIQKKDLRIGESSCVQTC